jgi:hypothetical protein
MEFLDANDIFDQNKGFFSLLDILGEIGHVGTVFCVVGGSLEAFREGFVMEKETDLCSVVVLESSRCLIAQRIEEDLALTIMGLISDDPGSWEEAKSVWPRYRSPAVCEAAESLPFDESTLGEVMEILAASESWMVIDFQNKRILTGGEFETVGRNAAFSMTMGDKSQGKSSLFIRIPPWWELLGNASLFSVTEPRQDPICKPQVDREFLYGVPFLSFVADRAFEFRQSPDWPKSDGDLDGFYELTLRVHRDWLMTPQEALGVKIPRELLHGAIDWSDFVTDGQERRFYEIGTLVAIPTDWEQYATAPMGSQELCMYFNYCRAMIDFAWGWCLENEDLIPTLEQPQASKELLTFLQQCTQDWMSESYEGGPSPRFVIECDRRRVPIGDGVVIEGMDEVHKENHIIDCNCPICLMMAEGAFGPSFSRIDGHHLELDEEFAFSMAETLKDWELENYGYSDISESYDEDDLEFETTRKEESVSVWTGVRSDIPFPGDRQGHLKMAFMVAEIVSVLQSYPNRMLDIQSLSIAFSEYRKADGRRLKKAAKKFKRLLETLAGRYPELVSKSADLQSRIDESARVLSIDGDD